MSEHIVFVRFFPGYSESFPYHHFVRLKNKDIAVALETLGAEWWSEPGNRTAVEASRSKSAEDRLKSETQIREWAAGCVARPGARWYSSGAETPEVETPPPLPSGPPSFQEIAHVAGWLHASVFGDWFPPHGISAFYPVTRFDAQDVAENAAVAIQSRVAELAAATFHKVRRNDDDRLFASVNPRFVVVAETELSLGELAKAREQLQRVEDAASGNVALEEGFVRFYLPKIRPTLDQIKALNTPFESKKQRFPKNEANIVVRDWLTEHGKDERVSIRDVEEGTCVPISSISGLSSWQSYQDEWGQKRKPELRTVPLSEPILAARRDGREDDPSVIAERKEDEDTWEQVLNSAESSTKRKQLVEMPADKRQELIELYRQQKRDEAAKP